VGLVRSEPGVGSRRLPALEHGYPGNVSVEAPERRSALEHALREAEERTLAEIDVVRGSLRTAVEAVLGDNLQLADEVVVQGREVERRYADVHDRLMALIARQTPVATDLRIAMALLHVNDRVERMGAQCVNIATLCSAMAADERPSERQLGCLSEMADLTDEQVREAARVFAERDVEGARRLREHDFGINEHNRRCFAIAVQEGESEARREAAFFVALMARALERIGDNAVDIGQQAAFAVTGRLLPSSGPAQGP
jgi:phosphate transport system protein